MMNLRPKRTKRKFTELFKGYIMQVVSKLSTKTMIGTIKPGDLPEVGEKPLFRIMGIVNGVKTGQSTYGDWLAFTGQFKAVTISEDGEIGEEFRSGVCFLPEIATDLVRGAIPEDGSTLEFAFDIGAVRFDSAQGYKFTVRPLVDAGVSDPFEAIANKLPDLPKLSAPKPEPESETEVDADSEKSGKSASKKREPATA